MSDVKQLGVDLTRGDLGCDPNGFWYTCADMNSTAMNGEHMALHQQMAIYNNNYYTADVPSAMRQARACFMQLMCSSCPDPGPWLVYAVCCPRDLPRHCARGAHDAC